MQKWGILWPLDNITTIWYIFWPIRNLVAIWYISPYFGILNKEESGNPASNNE
jgi:hypothetical protein